ncbi:MAG: hypothetical protein U0932_01085 [Thiobacillus sp.]|nr:hypothetical protein [Thiobacillus sp.]
MTKWATVAAVALAVLLIARNAQARAADVSNPNNWKTIPGFTPGAGYMT